MVKCCVCNVYSGTKEGLNLSFHSVPKTEEMRQQWKSILGNRFKEKGFICSAHFSPDQFSNSINNRRQRILPDALPSINLPSSWIASSTLDSQANFTPGGSTKYDDHIDEEENISPVTEINSPNIAPLPDTENSASVYLEEGEHINPFHFEIASPVQSLAQAPNIILGNEIVQEPSESIVRDIKSCYVFSEETIPNEPLESGSNTNQRLNRKRKCTFSDEIQSTKNRTVKVLGDFKPEDFKNPSDHRVITKYLEKHNSEARVLKQKVRRLEKKVDTFKSVMKDLKSRGFLSTDAAHELNHKISPELQELFNRTLASKSTPYSPKLQEIAASLMFYSNAGYEYVRTKLTVLPHPETVRRWFRNIKFTPGISEPVLQSIKKTHGNLYFGMICDEMHIKKHVESDGKVTYGFVDVGAGETNDTSEATAALVYMIVALNGHLKAPIAFYLINGMGAKERANITTNILCTLHDYNIDVKSLTFDGTSVNISMAKCLGATFPDVNCPGFGEEAIYFLHPVNTKQKIYIILDACHMLKLARNALESLIILNRKGEAIEFSYFRNLVDLQEVEGLHCGTKIRKRHVNFQNEKMKVNLAAQTLSKSTSDALTFLKEDLHLPLFEKAGPTAEFCRKINDMFDFLNVKSSFSPKSESLQCITADNLDNWGKKIDGWVEYIKSLCVQSLNTCEYNKINILKERDTNVPECNPKNVSRTDKNEDSQPTLLLKSNRRTGFVGFIVSMRGALELAREMLRENSMKYFLTYKLSQDHLETFFSVVRRQGGYNPNPTCRQFISAYRKINTHVHGLVSSSANCRLQDNTTMNKVSLADFNNVSQDDCELEDVLLILDSTYDHDYSSSNSEFWSEYKNNVISYIAGNIVKTLKKKIQRNDNCRICLDAIEGEGPPCLLQIRKDRGVEQSLLTTASEDVVILCKTAHKVVENFPSIIFTAEATKKLIYQTKKLLPLTIFQSIDDELVLLDSLGNHKFNLINDILSKYFSIILKHKAKSMKDKVNRVRSHLCRTVIFKNQ